MDIPYQLPTRFAEKPEIQGLSFRQPGQTYPKMKKYREINGWKTPSLMACYGFLSFPMGGLSGWLNEAGMPENDSLRKC